jgi:hypothetical protein
MAFTPKEPLNISAVGGDGKQTGFTKIKNEFAWLYATILSGLFSTTTGHKHTGSTNDAPKIGTSGIEPGSITTDLLAGDIVSPVATEATFAKGVPVGFIGMWSGSVANIPNIDPRYGTWKICDGTNGTIDLRNKFVVGAGSTYAVGSTGGEASHVLTIPEIPAHTHTFPAGIDTGDVGGGGQPYLNQSAGTTTTSSIGGGTAHNNLPPYYALCYIQRIS